MKTKFLLLALFIGLLSCSNDENNEELNLGKPTIIKGNVSDLIRGFPIENYQVILVRSKRVCSNWMCGLSTQEVSTAYTDANGNYEINFNYKLDAGESYGFILYKNTNYVNNVLQNSGINSGQTNIININAWQPIQLKLNVQVLNNLNAPLMINNRLIETSNMLSGSQFIYEENITKTYFLNSMPNSQIKILFWYHTGTNPIPIRHEKVFDYNTTFDDFNELNFTIDCSTF